MTYRVGNHQPRNLYRGDQYIGVCFDLVDTALIVDAMEGRTDTPDVDHTRGAAEALAHVAERIANAADDFDADTLATLRIILEATAADLGIDEETPSARSSTPQAAQNGPAVPAPPTLHRPERRGSDSEGYGQCTGCGHLWPCADYRGETREGA